MMSLQRKSFCCIILLFVTSFVYAQKAERDFIRKGNRNFRDSIYEDAEVNYRKALDVNPKSTNAMFNLANSLMMQNKLQDAMEQYEAVSKMEKDKNNLAQIFHNVGVIFHSQKDYAKAVEAYKESLRNNPKDDETRYNLVLAQKMLKDQQQNQQSQSQDQQDQQQDKEEQNQQQNQNNNDTPQSTPENKEGEISKENAEQLLQSVMQDEKNVQDKVKKQQVIQGGHLEKDW